MTHNVTPIHGSAINTADIPAVLRDYADKIEEARGGNVKSIVMTVVSNDDEVLTFVMGKSLSKIELVGVCALASEGLYDRD